VDIAMHIGQESPAAADRFINAVERSVQRLADFPAYRSVSSIQCSSGSSRK
jgi:plasmid stabilization system protein ParE